MTTNRQKSCKPSILTYKMNVVKINGRAQPECTNCGHRFDTDRAAHPYRAMCLMAMGTYPFCPYCGAKYAGCQIEGVDFNKCSNDLRDWIYRGCK